MSQITLSPNASGTGIFTVASPSSNSNRTLTLPDNTGTILTNATTTGFPAGSVLQVVQTTTSTAFSTSSGTFVSAGFSASITPTSSTSKILIIFSGRLYLNTAANEAIFSIYRGASPISSWFSVFAASSSIGAIQTLPYLDSPATTSSTTYALYMKTTGGVFQFMPNGASDGLATITLMEIAA